MTIHIADCGRANVAALSGAIQRVDGTAKIASGPRDLQGARAVILPCRGTFADCVNSLDQGGWIEPLQSLAATGVPILGIGSGALVMAQGAEQQRLKTGLGLIPGLVKPLQGPSAAPHLGWNLINVRRPHWLFDSLDSAFYANFSHSEVLAPTDEQDVLATTTYGCTFPSVLIHGPFIGCCFHPERSSGPGLTILSNFVRHAERLTEPTNNNLKEPTKCRVFLPTN